MDNNGFSPLFGAYLKNFREENGITLKEISDETKIRVNILSLIESEDHKQLPSEVFVKGFVRAYAKAIGADEKEAHRMYLKSFDAFNTHVQKKTKRSRQKKLFYKLLFATVSALCVIVASVYFIYEGYNRQSALNEKKQKVSDFPEEKRITLVDPSLKQNAAALQNKKNFRLEIITIKKTRIKIIIDSLKTTEYLLNPGDKVELEAKSKFNILAENAAGIKLFLNDIPVHFPGKSGQMVSFEIP